MKAYFLFFILSIFTLIGCSDDDNGNLGALRKSDKTTLINTAGGDTVIDKVFTNEVEISITRQNNYEGNISFRLNSVNTIVDKDTPGFFRTLDMNDNEIDLSEYVVVDGDKFNFKIEFSGINSSQYVFYYLNADDSEWIGNKNLNYNVKLSK
ncbi:hypothetical protein [Aquimarina mytili]|uniref:Uncharacterized protein n=1 Tax=Aquimarina mytili TaxID=874423 RepID=A0A937A8B6_9FLAO|nr:hypothetical protein [Aquimarina mytili]MBL0686074.1 hypothetical protein [Aquimarina mytili]